MKNLIFLFLTLSIALLFFSSPFLSETSLPVLGTQYFIDTGNRVSESEILIEKFTPLTKYQTSPPITNSPVWLKLPIPEASKLWSESAILFSGSTEMILSMKAFAVEAGQVKFIGECDVRLKSGTCEFANLQYAFPIPTKNTESILLKVDSNGIAIPNDFFVLSKSYYNKVNAFLALSIGLAFGAFLLMGLLNFAILITSKYQDLVYFCGYCVFGFIAVFVYRGPWDALMPHSWPTSLHIYFTPLFSTFVFEHLFVKKFFRTDLRHLGLNRAINAFIVFLLILIIVSWYEPTRTIIWQNFAFVSFVYPLFTLSMLLFLTFKQEQGAKAFLLAWSPVLFGFMIHALSRAGIMDGHWVYGYAPLALRPVQLFLFTLVIFERLKKMTIEIEFARAKEQQGNVVKTLLRTLSHDLSNTSGIISLNTDLAMNLNANPQITSFLERIKRAVNTQLEMIQNAKASYLKRGSNQAIILKPTDLRECLYAAIDAVEHKAFKKQIRLSFEEPKEIYIVRAERISLTHQVFVNLLDNAIKFTPADKEIKVSVTESNFANFILVNIADEGIGLSDDLRNKIFEEAPEISRPGTDNEEGTGLGLLVVRDFVAAYGGKIEVSSVPNKGTQFKIHLQLFGTAQA